MQIQHPTSKRQKGAGGPPPRISVEIDRIKPDPEQPRKRFDPEGLKGLAESIKAQGILQEISVIRENGKGASGPLSYVILDGERRWRAAKLAGLKVVPIIERTAPADKSTAQLVLNQQRENLTALEEAAAYRKALDGGEKPEELAKKLGVSRATVWARVRLTEIDPLTRKELEAGNISVSVAGLVMMVPAEERQELLDDIGGREDQGPVPFREAQRYVERYVRVLDGKAFLPGTDYGLNKAIVSAKCHECPKRSANLEGCGLKNPNVCTQPSCYAAKAERHKMALLQTAKAKGQEVLPEKEAEKLFEPYRPQELKSGAGYVDLAACCEPLGWDQKNTWGAVLRYAEKARVVVAVDPGGQVHELVEKVKAEKSLKETKEWKAAVKRGDTRSSSDGYDQKYKAEQKARQAEEKIRKTECEAISEALTAKVEGLKDFSAEWLWRMAARGLSSLAGFYVMQPIEKRRQWPKGQYGDVHAKALAGMTLGQAVGFVVEVVTSRDEDEQNAAAKQLKVDIKRIAKAAREGLKQKATKGTKKGAKK